MAEPSHRLIDAATGEVNPATAPVLMERIETLEVDLANAERDLRRERRRTQALLRDQEAERQAFSERDVIERLFAHWQYKTGHKRSKLGPTRFDAARARLQEGYSEQDMRRSVEGIAAHPNVKDGQTFDDFELCFRSERHLERYANLAPRKASPLSAASG